ncbi:MAG: helix-turn-helix transcriptional regulator [Bacillota bacterium]
MDPNITFGEYIKNKREALGESIRGLSVKLGMTAAYLSDIEKGNRVAPEKFLSRIAEHLKIKADEIDCFYDLAGKSRKNNYPDLTDYIGHTEIARIALRRARDFNISKEEWQIFIDGMKKQKDD